MCAEEPPGPAPHREPPHLPSARCMPSVQVLRSSAFEGMLLRATWPGNEAVPQDLLTEIIKHSIPAFKYGRAVRPTLLLGACTVPCATRFCLLIIFAASRGGVVFPYFLWL